jgi:ATP-dependent DNA ligase
MSVALAKETQHPELFVQDDKYAVSQKFDGRRMTIQTAPVRAFNRLGEEIAVPASLVSEFGHISNRWLFDGELLANGTYHVFDLLETPQGPCRQQPWEIRQALLTRIFENVFDYAFLVKQVRGEEEKYNFLSKCRGQDAEGVMFARVDAPYIKRRTKNLIKFKFVKQVDCVVTAKGLDDKDNLELAVYRDGEIVNVGRCSALTGDGPDVKVGDVVTVDILYATNKGRLYQPVRPRIRTDKTPQQCDFFQVIVNNKTNKKVVI